MDVGQIALTTLIVVGVLAGLWLLAQLIAVLAVGALIVVEEIQYPRKNPDRVLAGAVINKTSNGISGGNYTGRDL